MAATPSTAPGGRCRTRTRGPEPPNETAVQGGIPDGGAKGHRKETNRKVSQHRSRGKARAPAATPELVYVGLRCIGTVRDHGRQFEAWGEPGRQTLGRFPTHAEACRAVYRHDLEQRQGGRP